MNKLNIGSGVDYRNDCLNMDINTNVKADIYRDITRGLPFEDNTFDVVYMHHILEHIRDNDDFFFIINEVFRVLKIDGIFDICVPPYTFEGAFSDPTHCRFFTPRTFDIICGNNGEWDTLPQITAKFNKEHFEERSSLKDGTAKEYYVTLKK